MDYTQFHTELQKKDALIEAQTKLLGMLEMAKEVKIKMAHLHPIEWENLCTVLDDIWKAELMNVEAIEHLNK